MTQRWCQRPKDIKGSNSNSAGSDAPNPTHPYGPDLELFKSFMWRLIFFDGGILLLPLSALECVWGDRVSSSVSNLFHPVNISALIVKSDLKQTALSAVFLMSFHVVLRFMAMLKQFNCS